MSNVAVTISMHPDLFSNGRFFGLRPQVFKDLEEKSVRWSAVFSVREMAKALSSKGQGQPGGSAWKALSPEYLEYKRVNRMETIIGVASADMRKSIVPDTKGFDFDKQQKRALIGPVVPYAGYFNAIRPLVPVPFYLMNNWAKAHSELLLKALKSG